MGWKNYTFQIVLIAGLVSWPSKFARSISSTECLNLKALLPKELPAFSWEANFLHKESIASERLEKRQFLTTVHQLGLDYQFENKRLRLFWSKEALKNIKLDRKGVEIALQNFNQVGMEETNRLLFTLLPDSGKFHFDDWVPGSNAFHGSIEDLISSESFRDHTVNGKLFAGSRNELNAQWLQDPKVVGHNSNWTFVSNVSGEQTRSSVIERFRGKKINRELYWPTENVGFDRTVPGLSAYRMRVAVTYVDGIPREAETFVRENDTWYALAFEKGEDGKWVRLTKDSTGKPVSMGCVRCHGEGKNFGPTPKIPNYKRPENWFMVDRLQKTKKEDGVLHPTLVNGQNDMIHDTRAAFIDDEGFSNPLGRKY